MTNPVFIVDSPFAAGQTIRLDGEEGRHAATVKRIRVGEVIDIIDGQGNRGKCLVQAVGKDWLELNVEAVIQEPATEPRITAVQALAKGNRGDLALEMLTEVGVDVIVPWAAEHSVVKIDDSAKAHKKWQRTITEATKQSRRSWLPDLLSLHRTADVCELIKEHELALVLHESAERTFAEVEVSDVRSILLIIGPEGGISPTELSDFEQAGAIVVRMGSSVMRTSTAGAVAVGAILAQTNRWS